jgi:hypothetical protein
MTKFVSKVEIKIFLVKYNEKITSIYAKLTLDTATINISTAGPLKGIYIHYSDALFCIIFYVLSLIKINIIYYCLLANQIFRCKANE